MTRFKKGFKLVILSTLIILLSYALPWAATYYVDASVGNDNNSGMSESQPWRTVSAVKTKDFSPGDVILFKRGQSWNDTLIPRSGSSMALINYGAYGTGAKPVLRNFGAVAKSYVHVENLEFKSTNSDAAVYIMNGSHHISIQNCEIYASPSSSTWAALSIEMNSNFNTIKNCYVEHQRKNTQNDTVNVNLNCKYNLFEGNTIKGGTHSAFALNGASDIYPTFENKYNILRNNVIEAIEARPLEIMTNSNYNLIEGNKIIGGKETTYCGGGQNFKMVTSHNIIRYNIMANSNKNSAGGLSIYLYKYDEYPANNANGNRIYNNTLMNLGANAIYLGTAAPGVCMLQNNVFMNNIVYNNGGAQISVEPYEGIDNNYFKYNLIYSPATNKVLRFPDGSFYTVVQGQSKDPLHYSGNIQTDPMLDDSTYELSAGSPAIDAGSYLTTVTTLSGTGNNFKVGDASYFSDGFGIVQGDTISIGEFRAIIVSIDNISNTITVDRNISWVAGDQVSLLYSGSMADIGAIEYNLKNLQPPQGLRVMASW